MSPSEYRVQIELNVEAVNESEIVAATANAVTVVTAATVAATEVRMLVIDCAPVPDGPG
jgi:hypothetical protein